MSVRNQNVGSISQGMKTVDQCAETCMNTSGCNKFLMNWQDSDGNLGDHIGVCVTYDSISQTKDSGVASAIFTKVA